MRILALDASGREAGVALANDDALLASALLTGVPGHGATMATACAVLMERAGWRRGPEMIAVTVGPGSFTGLRIALGLAKGLAWGGEIPLVGLSTLEALAAGLARADAVAGREPLPILALMDARRGEVFAALFAPGAAPPPPGHPLAEPRRLAPSDLAAILMEAGAPLRVVGDGWGAHGAALASAAGVALRPAETQLWRVDPAALAWRALVRLHARGPDDLLTLDPLYLRRSDAETLRQRGG